ARLCARSHRERGGVGGYAPQLGFDPPHPNPLPAGEREHTERVAYSLAPPPHSITLSARNSIDSEMGSPIAFAARKLITSSNFTACSTGRSPGLAPLRTRST